MRRVAVTLALLALAYPGAAKAQDDNPTGVPVDEVGVTPILDGGAEAELGSKCRTVYAGRVKKSLVGITVWRYRQEIRWCWRANRITYLTRTRWGKTYLDCCWDYQGHIGGWAQWNAKWSYKAFTEGRFYWYGPPAPSSRTPEITMTVYGNGGWSHKTAG